MSDNLVALARKIIARVDPGTIAPPFKVSLQDATGNVLWEPTPHNCHSNVDTWLSNRPASSPKYSSVFGFVIVPPMPIWRPYWDVIAHAVIEAEDGALMDITPSRAEYVYPFVRHVGTVEEFQMFSDAVSVKVPV
jgi:hypothetical protein